MKTQSKICGKGTKPKNGLGAKAKNVRVTFGVPQGFEDAAKRMARKKGVSYHQMMREILADYVLKAA